MLKAQNDQWTASSEARHPKDFKVKPKLNKKEKIRLGKEALEKTICYLW